MAGFQENLTDIALTPTASGPTSTSAPISPSKTASVVSGIAGVLDTAAKALPLFKQIQDEGTVKDFTTEFQKLSLAKESGDINQAMFNTRVKDMNARLQLESSEVQRTVRSSSGLVDNLAERSAQQIKDNEAMRKLGIASMRADGVPETEITDTLALEEGEQKFRVQQVRAANIASLKANKELRTLQVGERVHTYTLKYGSAATSELDSLGRSASLVLAATDLSTTAAQEKILEIAGQFEDRRHRGIEALKADLRLAKERDPAAVDATAKAIFGGFTSVYTNLRSRVKGVQEAQIALLKAKRTNAFINLTKSSNFMARVAGIGGAGFFRGVGEALGRDGAKITAFSEVMKNAFQEVSTEGDTIPHPDKVSSMAVLQHVAKAHKPGPAAEYGRDNDARSKYVGANLHIMDTMDADGSAIATTDSAREYNNIGSKVTEAILSLESPFNMTKYAKRFATDSHKAIMKKVPPAEQAAVGAKVGGMAVHIARKSFQSINSIPGAVVFDTKSGQFVPDESKTATSTLTERLGNPLILPFIRDILTSKPNLSEQDKEKRAVSAITTGLNEMAGLFRDSLKGNPAFKDFTDAEMNYIFAKGNSTFKSLHISEDLDLKGRLPTGASLEKIDLDRLTGSLISDARSDLPGQIKDAGVGSKFSPSELSKILASVKPSTPPAEGEVAEATSSDIAMQEASKKLSDDPEEQALILDNLRRTLARKDLAKIPDTELGFVNHVKKHQYLDRKTDEFPLLIWRGLRYVFNKLTGNSTEETAPPSPKKAGRRIDFNQPGK